MKKVFFGVALLFAAGFANAQDLSFKNTLKFGVIGGASVPAENAVAGVGLDLAYQNLVTPHVGLGVASGYQHYFGKEATINGVDLKNNSFGVVPVAGLFRYYPKAEGFYLGSDVGYGVIVGDEQVTNSSTVNAERPNGGFYIKPEIGYHNRHWNVFAQYSKVFTGADAGKVGDQKYNAGMLGIGVAYNIPLGL